MEIAGVVIVVVTWLLFAVFSGHKKEPTAKEKEIKRLKGELAKLEGGKSD